MLLTEILGELASFGLMKNVLHELAPEQLLAAAESVSLLKMRFIIPAHKLALHILHERISLNHLTPRKGVARGITTKPPDYVQMFCAGQRTAE